MCHECAVCHSKAPSRPGLRAKKIAPCTICSYEVDCEDIVDLRTGADANLPGIDTSHMDCDWRSYVANRRDPPSWRIARSLISQGYAGILVPSFAREATRADQHLVLWKWSNWRPHMVQVLIRTNASQEISCLGIERTDCMRRRKRRVGQGASSKPTRFIRTMRWASLRLAHSKLAQKPAIQNIVRLQIHKVEVHVADRQVFRIDAARRACRPPRKSSALETRIENIAVGIDVVQVGVDVEIE